MFSGIRAASRVAKASRRSSNLNSAVEYLGKSEQAYKATKSDRLHSFWANGLLSRPGTQGRNIAANSSTLALRPFETLASASLDKVIGSADPKDAVYFREVLHESYGAIAGLQDAFAMGRNMFKKPDAVRRAGAERGLPTNLFASRKWELENAWGAEQYQDTWAELPMKVIGGVITSPGQALQGMDNFFKIMNYRMSMYKYLSRQAIAEGANNSSAINNFIQNGLKDPDAIFRSRSILDAEKATFTDAWSSETMKQVDSVIGNKFFRWITPFRKAPAKILKYSLDRTPFAPLSADVRQALASGSGSVRSEALGKIVTGSAMAATLYSMVGDRISGKAPMGSQQRALWEEAGNDEYSIRFGDTFYKFDMFGPLGLTLRVLADYYDSVSNIDLTNDQGAYELMSEFGSAITMPWANALGDMSFLRTFGNLISALDKSRRYEDESYIMRVGSNFASSFVWSGVSSIAHVIDPNRLSPSNPFEAVLAKIPGLTDRVPVRYNLFGEPIKYSDNYGPESQPYYKSQDINDELVNYLLNEVKYEVPRMTRNIGLAKLSNEEYAAYQVYAGQGVPGTLPLRRAFMQTLESLRRVHVPRRYIEIALDKLVVEYRENARNAMRMDKRFNIAEREQELMRQREL